MFQSCDYDESNDQLHVYETPQDLSSKKSSRPLYSVADAKESEYSTVPIMFQSCDYEESKQESEGYDNPQDFHEDTVGSEEESNSYEYDNVESYLQPQGTIRRRPE